MLKLSQIWPLGTFWAGCCVLVISPHPFFQEVLILSAITKYPISSPTYPGSRIRNLMPIPGISHFCEKPWFLSVGVGIEAEIWVLEVLTATQAAFFLALWMDRGREYMYVYITNTQLVVHTFAYIRHFIYIYKMILEIVNSYQCLHFWWIPRRFFLAFPHSRFVCLFFHSKSHGSQQHWHVYLLNPIIHL